MADRYWVAGGDGNYNSTTNWSATSGGASGASVPTTADDVFFNASSGAGTATITAFSNCRSLNLTGFTGTLQFNDNLDINGVATWNLGTGGYSTTGVSGIRVVGSSLTIVSNGTTWSNRLSFANSGLTVTLSDTLNVSGEINILSVQTINGNTLNVIGNISFSGTGSLGTTTIALTGTGTFSSNVNNVIRNNITINTSGTITMSGALNYAAGTFTYVSGTVITTGHELRISTQNCTLNTNGITWNDFSVSTNLTITLTSNLNISGTFFATLTSITIINGNTVNISGNLNNTQSVSGTSIILLSGTGTWSGGGTISNPLTINTSGTITISSSLAYSNGTLTYTAGTVITTGSTITINSATLNTSGMTWNNIILGNATLTSDLNVGGNCFLGTATINSNSVNVGGNLFNNGSPSGTATFNMVGTGTLSSVATSAIFNCDLNINTLGTITIDTLFCFANRTFNYIAGTVITTGSDFQVRASSGTTTLSTNGIVFNVFSIFSTGSFIVSLTNDLTVSNNFLVQASGQVTINGNTLNINGNLQFQGSNIILGTTLFNITGNCTMLSSINTRNNITINTLGDVQLGSNFNYSTGTFTIISGTIIPTSFFLNISANSTLNFNGITWHNILFSGGSVVITLTSNLVVSGTFRYQLSNLSFSIGSNTIDLSSADLNPIGGTFTMPSNLTCKSLIIGSGTTINANTLTVLENLTITQSVSGTTSIVYGGTGTWTANTTATTINNNFTINTAGTLTISGAVSKTGGIFTYTAGTIDDTLGTVVTGNATTCNISGVTWTKFLVSGTTTLTSNINATTFGTALNNNISFTLGGNTLNFTHLELGNTGTTTLPTAWVCQDIEFKNISSGVLTGNSITINGNITQTNNGVTSGTTTFTYAGTGTWTATGTGHFSNSVTINTAGTLTFISANLGGGIFTYTAGTVITTGSTLSIRGNGTTMNHGAIIWYNVTTTTNITSFILNNQLVCLNALTIDNSQVTFSGTDGTFDVYYLNLNSSGTVARNPRLVATKTYRVRVGFTSQGTLAFPITLSSTVAASQAIFTLDNGATIDVGFVNATDIDSSMGRTIYSYRGVFSNTLNWQLLPTDVVASTGGNSVFIN
jgi:hypothetical protein